MRHFIRTLTLISFVAVVLVAFAAVAQGTDVPQNINDLAADAVYALRLKKTGQWTALSLVVTQMLIFLIKKLDDTKQQMKKWGSVLILFLSAGASILAAQVGGMSLVEALIVFGITGLPKFLHDIADETGLIKS